MRVLSHPDPLESQIKRIESMGISFMGSVPWRQESQIKRIERKICCPVCLAYYRGRISNKENWKELKQPMHTYGMKHTNWISNKENWK